MPQQTIDDLCSLISLRAFHASREYRTVVTHVHVAVEAGVSISQAEREAKFYALEDHLAIMDLDAKIEVLYLQLEHLEHLEHLGATRDFQKDSLKVRDS